MPARGSASITCHGRAVTPGSVSARLAAQRGAETVRCHGSQLLVIHRHVCGMNGDMQQKSEVPNVS